MVTVGLGFYGNGIYVVCRPTIERPCSLFIYTNISTNFNNYYNNNVFISVNYNNVNSDNKVNYNFSSNNIRKIIIIIITSSFSNVGLGVLSFSFSLVSTGGSNSLFLVR